MRSLVILLTRTLLGYFSNASLLWGGGGIFCPYDLRNYWTCLKNSNGIWQPWKTVGKKIVYYRVTDDVTGQVKDKMFGIFTEVPADDFVARNGDLRRKQWLQIGMIWVSYTSKHHPKPMVTLGYVKVIRGHGFKFMILVIWHHNTYSLVSFSSRTRKMTLEHPLLHLNNKSQYFENMETLQNA